MSDEPVPAEGEILLYTTPNSQLRVEVPTINYHCKEIFASKELREMLIFTASTWSSPSVTA